MRRHADVARTVLQKCMLFWKEKKRGEKRKRKSRSRVQLKSKVTERGTTGHKNEKRTKSTTRGGIKKELM